MKFVSIVLLAGLASFASAAGPSVAGDSSTATLIRRQSQAFSDASATGNAAALARYLDDNVIFMNENGTLSTKKDIVSTAGPAPSGVSNTLVQTDWHLQLHGSVAVTGFTDVSTVHFHGQVQTARYRSTEVWLKEPDGWKMISSQTIALQDDPPAVALPAGVLAGYAGTYTAGPGYVVSIRVDGSALAASINGGAAFPLKAEVRDVFFVPGQPRLRRIFERDASGAVVGFVSRHEGHDIKLTRVRA
jgi:ketosteroid isomerase-like protein